MTVDASGPHPALTRLDVLVGAWTIEAGLPGEPPWPGEGRVTFEWLRDRAFMIERWTVPTAFDGVAIIGAGAGPDDLRRHYFDGRGEERIYEMTLDDGVWRQWRDAADPFPQRFHATLSEDGTTFAGGWEKRPGGAAWEPDIDVTYRRAAG